jgi:DNA repair exonuclease SbcCD ATPase subunit
MAELIPRMQPQNSMNKGAQSMEQSATGFDEKIEKLRGTLEALRKMSEKMNSAQSKYKESLSSETNFQSIRNDYEALKNNLERTLKEADDSSLKIGEIEKAYNTMQQQASKLCSQWEASDKLSYDSVLNAVDQIAHDEDEYRASMNSLNAKLEEEIAGIRQRGEDCIKLTKEWMNALGNYNADSRGHFRHCLCDVLILFAIATLFAYGLFVWRNNEVSDLKKQNQALYEQNKKLKEQNKEPEELSSKQLLFKYGINIKPDSSTRN